MEPVAAPAETGGEKVAAGRRLLGIASKQQMTLRLLGGGAVYLKAPPGGPLLPRAIGDIDLAIKRGSRGAVAAVLTDEGYVPDEMFNALQGARRLLFYGEATGRK